jgi:hypothetical protein
MSLAVALVPIVCFAVLVAMGWWCMAAPALPPDKMAAVNQGMTREEVQSLLGPPQSESRESDGSETWMYHRRTWAMFLVAFSPEGHVVRAEHDY